MKTIEQLRAEAREQERQLDAVLWSTAQDLAKRWGVSAETVRGIGAERLPYLTLGKSNVRRYHPDDVRRFEESRLPAPKEAAS